MQPHLSDLLGLCRAGDESARGEILEFLGARFLGLAKHRVVREDAPDIVQETLMVVNEHLAEIQTVEGLIGFTNKTMRHKIGNYYQKRARRRLHEEVMDPLPEPQFLWDPAGGAEAQAKIIDEAISRVAVKHPKCLALFVGLREGLTPGDLCTQLGLPREQIDQWLCRCRERLRKAMAQMHQPVR